MAGGMPLAFMQEDFLVIYLFRSKWPKCPTTGHCPLNALRRHRMSFSTNFMLFASVFWHLSIIIFMYCVTGWM